MTSTVFDKFPILSDIPVAQLPKHIFIIPDGNGRWAKEHALPVSMGHKKGFSVAEEILKNLSEIGAVKIVTMWGFSSDNWKRDTQEIAALMHIFEQVVKKAQREFPQTNRRFVHIGRKDRIPQTLRVLIEQTEKMTEKNSGQIFCLAVDFGGEDQNIRMLQNVLTYPKDTVVDSDLLWNLRDGKGVISSADLLIRTSGEKRTSDVGWFNGAPTELYFTTKYFPELTMQDIVDAIVDFSKRERRMGGRK